MRSQNRHGWGYALLIGLVLTSIASHPLDRLYQDATAEPSVQTTFDAIPSLPPEPTATPTSEITNTSTPELSPVDPLPTSEPATTISPDEQPTLEPSLTPEPTKEPLIQALVGYDPEALAQPRRPAMRSVGQTQLQIELAKIGIQIVEIPQSQLDLYTSDDGIEFIERNGELKALDTIPNDSGYPQQWGLPVIQAPAGWDITTGNASIVIAIIDTGVDLGHTEFAGRLLPGYDFINNDAIPQDDEGHGTHVAGIAAGMGNNGSGIAGMCWNCGILPVKALDAQANGTYASVAASIVFAVDNGAQVINLSLGGPNPSSTLKAAIDYAVDRGVMVIAAAGNDASSFISYPAAYNAVIAVGATNQSNNPAGFSNRGAQMDLAAPGVDIYSTLIGSYGLESGTSMSTPFVSGLAALLFSLPKATSSYSVERAMKASALDISASGWDARTGYGLIQVDAAINYLLTPPTPAPIHNTPVPTRVINVPVIFGLPSATQVTLLPTMTNTPTLANTGPELSGQSTAQGTVIPEVTSTPTLLNTISTATSGSKSTLPLIGGVCLTAGGLILLLAIWLWKRQKNQSE